MSVLKALAVSKDARTQMELTFAPATLATPLPEINSAAQVWHNV